MKFSKIVFWIAGILGLLLFTPHYFMFNAIGHNDPPPITHPEFFYGFVGAAVVWQIAFLFIAVNPVRLRPMMIPCVLEKFASGVTILALVLQHRMFHHDFIFAAVELLFALLFLAAFFLTSPFPRAST
jgi:hypothetical protein